MPIDTSMYNNITPLNPFDTIGKATGIANALQQNQLLQQQNQQQQMQTQQMRDNQKFDSYLSQQQQANPSGSPDPNAAGMWLATNAPLAYGRYQDWKNGRLALTPQGVDQTTGAAISKPLQQQQAELSAPNGSHTVNTSTPQGFTTALPQSRANYNQVNRDANSAPDRLAAFNEIVNLNDAGAKTGTAVSDMYQKLAKTGLVPDGITDQATQTQVIGKYIHRAYVDNLPDSDYRAHVLESSQIGPEQLSSTIHDLVPFMKAQTQGLVAKQKYYNQQTKGGTDLTGEPVASQTWNQNYDPRWLEVDSLPNRAAQVAFLQKHPDMIGSKNQYQGLQNMGVVDGAKSQ